MVGIDTDGTFRPSVAVVVTANFSYLASLRWVLFLCDFFH